MEVRPIRPDELARLAGLDGDPVDFAETLSRLLDGDLTRPEWCFLALEGGRPEGRVVYWRQPSVPQRFHLFGLLAKTPRAGLPLLRDSLKRMALAGATEAECQDSSAEEEDRSMVLRAAGFELLQVKRRFVREKEKAPALSLLSPGLEFRSLREEGEDGFLRTIREVMRESLDRDDRLARKERGAERAARDLFGTLLDIDDRPDHWQMAYDGAGDMLGLVVPQRFSSETGAINYVGVVPAKRGRGYGEELIAEGIRILERDGLRRILADIDSENIPLARSLPRLGFREEKSFRLWRAAIGPPAGGR